MKHIYTIHREITGLLNEPPHSSQNIYKETRVGGKKNPKKKKGRSDSFSNNPTNFILKASQLLQTQFIKQTTNISSNKQTNTDCFMIWHWFSSLLPFPRHYISPAVSLSLSHTHTTHSIPACPNRDERTNERTNQGNKQTNRRSRRKEERGGREKKKTTEFIKLTKALITLFLSPLFLPLPVLCCLPVLYSSACLSPFASSNENSESLKQ